MVTVGDGPRGGLPAVGRVAGSRGAGRSSLGSASSRAPSPRPLRGHRFPCGLGPGSTCDADGDRTREATLRRTRRPAVDWGFASPQNPHKVRVHGRVPHKKPTDKTAQSGTIRHGVLR